MGKISFIIFIFLFFFPTNDESCCKKIEKHTKVKYRMDLVLAKTPTVQVIRGKVVDVGNEPLSGVLIEVIRLSKKGENKIIHRCLTQKEGKFDFKFLKEGKYFVSFSKDWHDKISLEVTVSKKDSKSDKNKAIEIVLPEGT